MGRNLDNRVVVTGIGIISPLGLDVESTWKALISGLSGVNHITFFDPEPFETRFAAEVKGFDPLAYLDRKDAKRMDRCMQFAVVASKKAVEGANLRIDETNSEDIGVIIGSGIGGITTLSQQFQVLAEKGPSRVSPFLIPMMISDMSSGQVSISLGAKGPNFCTTSSCSSGADAIGVAFNMIAHGDIQAVIAGGSEAPITPIALAGFSAAGALSKRNDAPQKASRPFDAQRDGFVIGEGATVLVLESLPFAMKRNAPILAELVSYGATGDAYHITQPASNGEGGARAMRIALKRAGLEPKDIDYINAHGTSTPLNDKFETMAIKAVFGEEAYRVPVSSTKSMTGHLLGASGALEAAICSLAIQRGAVPPTINLEYPDPDCDLDYVPHLARRGQVRTALSNSFGFGGHNSCLIFKKYEG
ncbi:MAG: beta-ketoacyl-ACP synthase II [Chloroflexi bacterium]|nr:beta-ketoacyl-ACP synthase II [Chloroflexota bacterium]